MFKVVFMCVVVCLLLSSSMLMVYWLFVDYVFEFAVVCVFCCGYHLF